MSCQATSFLPLPYNKIYLCNILFPTIFYIHFQLILKNVLREYYLYINVMVQYHTMPNHVIPCQAISYLAMLYRTIYCMTYFIPKFLKYVLKIIFIFIIFLFIASIQCPTTSYHLNPYITFNFISCNFLFPTSF